MDEHADLERQLLVLNLFERACDLEAEQRQAFLDEHCAGDRELQAELESLLAEDDATDPSFVVPRLAEKASRLVREVADKGSRPSELKVPERVGSFRVIGRLGHGGMSLVYEAEQDAPRRRVALKMLRAGLVTREERARFEREVQVLGRLHHAGIAQVFEAGVLEPAREGEEARPWFAMELVDGRPLTQHAEELGLDWRQRCALLAEVCEAAHHAHVKGVIHRDLKPANVLVDAAGRPRILDFGVASAEDELSRGELRTKQGVLLGTLQYMAPEQARGDASEADVRSDVYALGLLAYELLSGRPARDLGDQSIASATRTVLEAAPPRLGQVAPGLKGDPEAVVAKACQDDPERRHQSALALAEDLRALAAGEAVSARRPSAWDDFRRLVRRREDVFTVAAVGIVALALLSAFAMVQAFQAEQARDEEARQRAVAEEAAQSASLAAAQLALETGDVGMLRRRLEAVPEERRGWAWRHLAARADDSLQRWPGNGNRTRGLRFDSATGLAVWAEAPPLAGEQRLVIWDLVLNVPVFEQSHRERQEQVRLVDSALPLYLLAPRLPAGADELVVRSEQSGRVLARVPRCEGATGSVKALLAGDLRVVTSQDELLTCDAATGALRSRAPREDALELRVDPLGRFVLGLSQHGPVTVMSLPELEHVARLEGHSEGVRELAVSPDGNLVVTASRDGTLRWWSLPAGKETARLSPHRGSVDSVAISPCGTFVASSGDDGAVRIWDAHSHLEVATLLGHVAGPSGLAFSEDGTRLLSVGRDGGRLWWIGERADPRAWREHESYVYDLALSPDGEQLASISWDGSLIVRSLTEGRVRHRIALTEHPSDYPLAVAWSGDGRTVVTTTKRTSVRPWEAFLQAWDAGTGEPLARVELGTGHPLDLGFTAADGHVLAGCGSSWVAVDAATWEPDGRVAAVEPDLIVLAERGHEHEEPWCSTDDRHRLREDGEALLRSAMTRAGFANAAALSPDGSRLAVAVGESVVLVATGGGVLARHAFDSRRVYALGWDSTGSKLFMGADDSLFRVLDPESLEAVLTLDGHANYIKSLAVEQRSDAVYTASGDTTVRLWDDRSVFELHGAH